MLQKTFLKTKNSCKVKFSLKAETADTVEILGLNNDWETPVEMKKKKDGSFSAEVSLPKNSTHEFKYRINATEWLTEDEADHQVENNHGTSNSVIVL